MQTYLQCAQANSVPLVARSSGHYYGGYSTTTGLMVNVSTMITVSYNLISDYLTVGAERVTHTFGSTAEINHWKKPLRMDVAPA